MNEAIQKGKRAFAIMLAVTTVLWSIGFAMMAAPLTASAQSLSTGDLVTGETLSTVYYYASDGQRYAFPNSDTYFSWHSDFSGVQQISDSELAAIPLGGNIVNRPGSNWIKIQSDPKTYAVTPQGQIRWIESESVAEGLQGSDWNQFILDVPDVFFTDYTVGPSLTDASDAYNGALVDDGGDTYLVWDGEKRMVTDAGFSANRFQDRFVLDGTGIDLSGMTSGSDITGELPALTDDAQLGGNVTGGLEVSAASDTPASATIPGGADSVAFTKVKLMASSGSSDVDQVTMKLGGVGDVNNIDEAYLYDGNMRLTDGRSINSQTREVTFSALDLSLDAGESTYLTVRADTAAGLNNGGDTANFGIMSEGDISASASVSGNFPIVGNTMTFSEQEAGTIMIEKTGSISDPTLGEKEAEIGKFTLETDDEDGHLHRITLNIDDAADHSNYKLYNGSDMLASGESNGDELVTFELTNPFFLEEGDSENFDVTADIGGDSGEDLSVAVEEASDIVAIGDDFGFNMGVDISNYDDTSCTASTQDCSYSMVEGGDLTFAFNGPSARDIQVDGDDQVFLDFTVTTGNYVELEELQVQLDCTSGGACADAGGDANGLVDGSGSSNEANLTNFTIRTADGSTFMGPEELTGTEVSNENDDSTTFTFDDNRVLQAGESVDLMFTADVESSAADGDEYEATLLMGAVSAEDVNGDALTGTDIVPSGNIVGNTMTLSDASLDVQVSTPPSSATYVKGASNVGVVGFAFEAGDTSDVNVTDLTYTVMAQTDATFVNGDDVTQNDITVQDKVNSCSLYDSESGAMIDGPESPDGNDEILFDSFDWTVPAGETKKALLRCNFANVDTDGGNDDAYAFYIEEGDAGNIVAEDEDGDDVAETLDEDNDNDSDKTSGVSDTIVTLTDAGSIDVSLAGSSPNSEIILGSSTGIKTSEYEFSATDENFTVTDLTLVNCVGDTSADNNCGDLSGVEGSDAAVNNVKLSYKNAEGETKTKTGFLSGGKVTFSGLDFFVPSSDERVLTVMVDTAVVSGQDADSGDEIQLSILDSGGYNLDGAGGFEFTSEFEAVGDASGETVEDFGGSPTNAEPVFAKKHTLRKTKPTLSLASGSPSGAGVPGFSDVFRFNVSADSRGKVTMEGITFSVTAADANSGSGGWSECDSQLGQDSKWSLYDADDSSTELDVGGWTFYDTSGDCTGNEQLEFAQLDLDGAAEGAEEIGAGNTNTYVLEVDTTGASTSADDSLRIDLPRESTADAAAGGPLDAIRWLDAEETPTGSTDCDTDGAPCIDGDRIDNLPVRGGTIIY
jgi:hypothetical protein